VSDGSKRPGTVGLTGGIGSGKSTVAQMFISLGVPVLDLDRVGHEVIQSDVDVRKKLIGIFGPEITGEDGAIDRKKLAEKAFVSEEMTRALNAIVHPAIRDRERQWISGQKGAYVIIEASVLIESGGAGRMDRVVVVLADEAIRRRRVASRGTRISSSMFDAIVSRQCDDAERLRQADEVIVNNDSMNTLQNQVETLHRRLLGQFGS